MSWFETIEPYNESLVLEPDGKIILLLYHPLVALSLILYTLVIIKFTADLAIESYSRVFDDFTDVCPHIYYNYHTIFNYINPAFWMSLSHAFLLSNWEIIPSLCLVHLIFFTFSVFFTTMAYFGSLRVIPVSKNLKHVSGHKYFIAYLALTMISGEFILWCFYAKSEHPLIGKLFFFASLLAFLFSFMFHNHYTMSTKFYIIQDGKIVQLLYREMDDLFFKEFEKKKCYVYVTPPVEKLPV